MLTRRLCERLEMQAEWTEAYAYIAESNRSLGVARVARGSKRAIDCTCDESTGYAGEMTCHRTLARPKRTSR